MTHDKDNSAKDSCVEYPEDIPRMEGALAELPKKLSGELEFDSIQLDGLPASKRFTLWFRYGAKRVFHVRMIRSGGRCLVEMGGMDATKMLNTINICRDHFDAWFEITSRDIRTFECSDS